MPGEYLLYGDKGLDWTMIRVSVGRRMRARDHPKPSPLGSGCMSPCPRAAASRPHPHSKFKNTNRYDNFLCQN
ncbi:hypothetical protein JYU34_017441 [Plutella xylostella]|uniref:Uncharacterized protein n=1 Tax=Plutella xylostella TaxID=51655 RepID=A0ABQ7Q1D3_PLUXY|nr:hypothetical protein JYU34_017441 [Plutella xylostella]